jgi:chromosome segregation ATPase
MTATDTTPTPKPTPFDRKRTRLQNNLTNAKTELATVTARRATSVVEHTKALATADLALQHAREDAAAAEEAALTLVAKRDRLLAELEHVRAAILHADEHRARTITELGAAQQRLAEQEAALREASKPFDNHIAALEDDVERYAYRLQFVGVNG